MSKKPKWKKIRPDSNDELEESLFAERALTRRWYQRISGEIPWSPGERERLYAAIEAQSANVDRLIQENAAKIFAELPDE